MLAKLFPWLEKLGRRAADGVAEVGFATTLLGESFYWLFSGHRRHQAVHLHQVIQQCMEIGIYALPIISILSAAIGLMLAIQGLYTLGIFGAQSYIPLGVGLPVVREFSPLITGILVAGRSGSALAARLGTMQINQEIDALTVMGISPVRFLVVPPVLAMVIMMPLLVMWSNIVSISAAAFYVSFDLGVSVQSFLRAIPYYLKVDDVLHGLGKSMFFAVLIAIIGVINGLMVKGGAEGVGRMTTRAVVHSISAIVLTDMIFAFIVTR